MSLIESRPSKPTPHARPCRGLAPINVHIRSILHGLGRPSWSGLRGPTPRLAGCAMIHSSRHFNPHPNTRAQHGLHLTPSHRPCRGLLGVLRHRLRTTYVQRSVATRSVCVLRGVVPTLPLAILTSHPSHTPLPRPSHSQAASASRRAAAASRAALSPSSLWSASPSSVCSLEVANSRR